MANFAYPMPNAQRRKALNLGLVNGLLWAIGNGLTTGPLVIYLALDMGATGLALSLLLALPNLAGMLRMVAPATIHYAGTAKRACLGFSLASYLLIVGLPALAYTTLAGPNPLVLTAMIGLLFVHQLLEFLGTVALWSWWADLVPAPIRGRYFARRQAIQLAALIPTLLISGYWADRTRDLMAGDPQRLLAYALPTGVGALFLLASLVPLQWMPATRRFDLSSAPRIDWQIRAPLDDRQFWPVLIFRMWFSFANGITQVVQSVYPRQILGFGVGDQAAMRTVMQAGQIGASRWVGKASDRFGNRPVLVVGQACVALSLVFFLLAHNGPTRWLLVGAWVLFAAYVAHNICLPNLVLKLSPPGLAASYIGASDALGSLVHAASTILSGVLYDWLSTNSSEPSGEPYRTCVILLTIGIAMRLLAVPLAAAIREPGAASWRSLFSRSK